MVITPVQQYLSSDSASKLNASGDCHEEKQTTPTAISLAMKTKQKYMSALSGAANLINVINESPEWQWARGSRDAEVMGDDLKSLSKATAEQFVKDFMALPLQGVKKKYTSEDLEIKCAALANHLGPLTDKLQNAIDQLVKMHGARV